jgi:hypothetical protein
MLPSQSLSVPSQTSGGAGLGQAIAALPLRAADDPAVLCAPPLAPAGLAAARPAPALAPAVPALEPAGESAEFAASPLACVPAWPAPAFGFDAVPWFVDMPSPLAAAPRRISSTSAALKHAR